MQCVEQNKHVATGIWRHHPLPPTPSTFFLQTPRYTTLNANISRTREALNMRFSPFERGKGVELNDFSRKMPHFGPYFGLKMDLKSEYF